MSSYITLKNHLEYLSYAKHHANNQLHQKTPYFILLVKFKDLEIYSKFKGFQIKAIYFTLTS